MVANKAVVSSGLCFAAGGAFLSAAFTAPVALRGASSEAVGAVVEHPAFEAPSASTPGVSSPLIAGVAAALAGSAVAGAARKSKKSSSISRNVKLVYGEPTDDPELVKFLEWEEKNFGNMPPQMWYTGGPTPEMVWDPLGLSEGKTEEQLLHWRAVELKHGRVAMLACLGWFHVAAGWHFIGDAANGYVRVSDDPLVNVAQLPMGGMWQLVFTILVLEWMFTYVCKPPKEAPWDILGWSPIVVETKAWREHQLRELNNGRLAMFGILGLIIQDATTGEYFAEIAKPCFGACNPWAWDGSPPFQMDQLYPMMPSN